MPDDPARGKSWGSPEDPAPLPEHPLAAWDPMKPPARKAAATERRDHLGKSGLGAVEGPAPQPANAYERGPTQAQRDAWDRAEAWIQRFRGPPVRHQSEIDRESAQRVAAIEAREDEERLARWGDPREALRRAHQAAAAARTEIARRKDILAGALAHRDQCRLRMEELSTAKAAADERVVQLIRDSIEGGRPVAAQPADIDLAGEFAAARQNLELAERAAADFTGLLDKAEAAEAKARDEIAATAEQVIIARGLQIADRLAELEVQQKALRGSLDGLDRVSVSVPTTPVPAQAMGQGPRVIALPRRLARAFGGRISDTPGAWGEAYAGLLENPDTPLPEE